MNPAPDTRRILDQQLEDGDLDGYLWIQPAATPTSRPDFAYTPRSAADAGATKSILTRALSTVLMREQLAHRGLVSGDVNELLQPIQIKTLNSPRHADPDSAYISVTILFFLMYFVIMLYGMNVARSIIEEKTSRIFEVMLATIRPEEMMAGKILGVGSVGLTQVGIWFIAAAVAMQFGLLSSGTKLPVTASQAIFFVIFFLLGFILYSSIGSAFAAMTSSQQELQQMNTFLMMPIIACSAIIFRVVTDSDGPIALVFSFIPFCTPLIMFTRIAVHQPPAWQIALAIADLILTILAVLWVATRIYRVGILMYGKRPNLPEILRWLKYS